jgi:hypothetical protein
MPVVPLRDQRTHLLQAWSGGLGATMSRIHGQMSQLILKRASASRPSGQWRDGDLRRGGAALLSPASSSHRPRRRTAPGCGRPVITATSSALPSATSQWRRWRTDPAPALGTKAAPLLIRGALRPRRIPAGRRSCRTSRSWGGRTDASAECHWASHSQKQEPRLGSRGSLADRMGEGLGDLGTRHPVALS